MYCLKDIHPKRQMKSRLKLQTFIKVTQSFTLWQIGCVKKTNRQREIKHIQEWTRLTFLILQRELQRETCIIASAKKAKNLNDPYHFKKLKSIQSDLERQEITIQNLYTVRFSEV
uniref:Uncharacterized protein n=1 Tax=Rhizophora mucronata TaxID=61149 RepID=A0A2P2P2X2_RHIMU